MSESTTLLAKLSNRVFPRVPDFYGLIMQQCLLANQAATLLEEYLSTSDKTCAAKILKLEQDGEVLRQRNLDILKSAFATPLDREDIYRAITSVDCILSYAQNIVFEMDTLEIKADSFMQEMVATLRQSVETLGSGYQKLSTSPSDAGQAAMAVIKSRRTIEKIFRDALSQLFQGENHVQRIQERQSGAEAQAMTYVLDIFKRREIYRHIFDAGIDIKKAGKTLHDIVVQVY
ncbi:MAG: DUF47 family protein [Magnetococcales bacterium]|nr:DUF47 family protein [Magnetococcales bacterium]